MRLKKAVISNFRNYKIETDIKFSNLVAFVGKNDIGKSSVLEALDIFFNSGAGVIKIDQHDINKYNRDNGNDVISISAIFDDLPEALTIDVLNPTNLKSEYLLNADGCLEICKKYSNAGKEKVFIKALHPTNPHCCDLLLKKITELKRDLGDIPCANKTKSAEIRKAIWNEYVNDLQLQEIEIDVTKEDAKNIWDQIKTYMPLYALFQSDRKNSDGDNEVQDPLKEAVKQIFQDREILMKLNEIAVEVESKLKEVSTRTLEKLREMNPNIADSLNPVIPSTESLKWAEVFKNVSITGDNEIPINKRGSGIKRLVLINFFRAEAERRKTERNVPNIIYAIEEPETSQHPEHQRQLIEAFRHLASLRNTQVIITTHSPAIVKLLNFEDLRLLRKEDDLIRIENIEKNELPYPSLNEVNYLAFNESNDEYHNELYGFIESEDRLLAYKNGKELRDYIKQGRGGARKPCQVNLSEYIRHQIHHPENTENTRFTNDELQESIGMMRDFIKLNLM
jgi:predicted ATP-dependent endonuclease of OLD family